ncbi:MAG: NosD domain-containing protein [Bacteroidota bacterium]
MLRNIYTIVLSLMLLIAVQPLRAGSYVVHSTADAGAHSLRWALLQANASTGPDVITFEIPGDGPFIITPNSPLPPLTDPAGVIIDGLSQNGSSIGMNPPATMQLRIVLDGRNAGDAPGIWILSSLNRVQGLVINGFSEDGIRIQATPQGTIKNIVRHCMIGLDVDGHTARPNGTGTRTNYWAGISIISISHSPGLANDNLLLGNVVSGNHGDGILLADCMGGRVFANSITGNSVGSSLSGDAPVGNQRDGILLYGGCYGNSISGNLIVANGSDGLHLVGDQTRNAQAHHNTIKKNVIGITYDNKQMGNTLNGINIGGKEYEYPGGFASNNSISGNTIAANKRNGIAIWEYPGLTSNSDENRISQNAIFANTGLGIDLGDDGVSDAHSKSPSSPNGMIASPTIIEANYGKGVATVRGSVELRGKADLLTVELYKCSSGPARKCQGPMFLGTATPDENGIWLFSTNGLLELGDSVGAVLIDDLGNTSEFAIHQPVRSMAEYGKPLMADLNIGKSDSRASALLKELLFNPAATSTEIKVDVVKDCWGILEIYTEDGELVLTLVDRWMPKGEYAVNWNRINWRGTPVQAGTYICRLDANGVRQTTTISLR